MVILHLSSPSSLPPKKGGLDLLHLSLVLLSFYPKCSLVPLPPYLNFLCFKISMCSLAHYCTCTLNKYFIRWLLCTRHFLNGERVRHVIAFNILTPSPPFSSIPCWLHSAQAPFTNPVPSSNILLDFKLLQNLPSLYPQLLGQFLAHHMHPV